MQQANVRVDGKRLWASLMELAQIGATAKGGVCRLALSELDRDARRRFVGWCEEAGCTVAVDAIGNIFARRAGRPNRPTSPAKPIRVSASPTLIPSRSRAAKVAARSCAPT